MNFDELKGNWNVVKGSLKQKFSQLTDEDLMYREGQFEEMLGNLQLKLGQKKDDFEKILNEISQKLK
jgi:uncharacterized protein YjbJ (UPF0337 family)